MTPGYLEAREASLRASDARARHRANIALANYADRTNPGEARAYAATCLKRAAQARRVFAESRALVRSWLHGMGDVTA